MSFYTTEDQMYEVSGRGVDMLYQLCSISYIQHFLRLISSRLFLLLATLQNPSHEYQISLSSKHIGI